MRIAPSFIKTVIKPTQKSLQEFVRSLHTTYQNFSEAFNGRVSYGDGTNTENIDGSWASLTTPTPTGTNFTVTHGLNRTPVGVHVMQKNAFCDVLIVSSTSTTITLQASAAGAVIKLFIFLLFLFLIPFSSFAQGVRHVNIAQGQVKLAGSSGFSGNVSTPLAGATITVCTGSTLPASGSTCTGLASIYVDIGLTGLLSNPTNADTGGNYSFYAVGGVPYVVSVSAVGFTTFSYVWSAPISGTSPSFTGTVTAVNLTVSGTGTIANLNNVQWAGPGATPTAGTAISNLGSNPGLVGLSSTYSGANPSSIPSNIAVLDLRGPTMNWPLPATLPGGTVISFAGGQQGALQGLGVNFNPTSPTTTEQAITATAQYTGTFPGSNGTLSSVVDETDIVGAVTVGASASRVVGNEAYLAFRASSFDLAVADARGFTASCNQDRSGLGQTVTSCAGYVANPCTVTGGATGTFANCYGVDAKAQTVGTTRNYGVFNEGALLQAYNQKWDVLDNSSTTRTFLSFGVTNTNEASFKPLADAVGISTYNQAGSVRWLNLSSAAATFGVAPTPSTAGGLDLGSTSFPWGSLWINGVVKNSTATMGLTLKKGTGAGNYTTASTTYVVVDSTNLCQTVTIPTGWKLGVQVAGEIGSLTAVAQVSVAITDNASCSTANAGLLQELVQTPVAAGTAQAINLSWVVTGDGASHNIALQFKTAVGADSAFIQNTSSSLLPSMVFTLMPSN